MMAARSASIPLQSPRGLCFGVRMIEYSVGSSVIVPVITGARVQVGMTGLRVRFWGDVTFCPEAFREPEAVVVRTDGEEERGEGVYPVKNA